MTPGTESHRSPPVVVASMNPNKLREFSQLLPCCVRLTSIAELNVTAPEETGQTFLDNAMIKAEHASRETGFIAISDDSGLEVLALGGRPGVYSARYAGPNATDDENNSKLILEMANVSAGDRQARFVAAVAIVAPGGAHLSSVGSLGGWITTSPRGKNGFGYDPYFRIDDDQASAQYGLTIAELSDFEKNQVSHRRRAIDGLRRKLARCPVEFPNFEFLRSK